MVAAPGITAPGSRCDAPVSLLDLFPTLVDLCELGAKEGLEGESLVPWLEDPTRARERPARSTWLPGNHSLRNERWRYIRYADGAEELYDHASDATERNNLSGRPEYAEIKAGLARWLPTTEAPYEPV